MKEKQPTTGIDFGVPKFSVLYNKAIKIIEQDYEIDQFKTQNKLEWLYDCYKESIYPECLNAWRLSIQALLADADLDELLSGSIDHWYMGYAPSRDGNNWEPTLINTRTAIGQNTGAVDNIFKDLAIDELNHLKLMLAKDMISEDEIPKIANRAAELYLDCNASLSVTLYDYSSGHLDDKPKVLTSGKLFAKRAPASVYHKPISINSDYLLTRTCNDDLLARDENELEEILANSWANAQVACEYGYVIGCGSVQVDDVVELPDESELSSLYLPSASEPSS